jgi:hypothetical protein
MNDLFTDALLLATGWVLGLMTCACWALVERRKR